MAASNSALLYVITGPVGPYYPTGFKPVTLLADPKHVRAAEGGSGAFKMGWCVLFVPEMCLSMCLLLTRFSLG